VKDISIGGMMLPFLIALLHVMTAATAVGMIPALYEIGKRRRLLMFLRWLLAFVLLAAAAAYGLPLLMDIARDWTGARKWKEGARYFAWAIGFFSIFFLIPEPRRIALGRMKVDRPRSSSHRGYRVG
jgi:hypothetical protein